MLLGVASDIHGKRPALQAVVAELEREHLLADFPSLRLIIAHCGFAWSEHVLFMLAAGALGLEVAA